MNMKCLIEILKEKEYIEKVDVITLNNKECVFRIETKYKVVINKILEVADDISYYADQITKYLVDVVDLSVLKEWVEKNCTDEKTCVNQCFITDENVKAFKKSPAISNAINDCLENYKVTSDTYVTHIINLKKKDDREKEEERKRIEVVNFINSLP